MNLSMQQLEKYRSFIQGFNSELVPLEGIITLLVKADTYPLHVTIVMNFLVVKLPTSSNAILGCPKAACS